LTPAAAGAYLLAGNLTGDRQMSERPPATLATTPRVAASWPETISFSEYGRRATPEEVACAATYHGALGSLDGWQQEVVTTGPRTEFAVAFDKRRPA
jgi:hypothetical protein